MNIEQQCISLDLAKRLKELGVKQSNTFDWWWNGDKFSLGLKMGSCWHNAPMCLVDANTEHYSAFNVAELGEILPDIIYRNEVRRTLEEKRWSGRWISRYVCERCRHDALTDKVRRIRKKTHVLCFKFFAHNYQAHARGEMLVYLLEKEIIKKEHL